MDKRARCVRVCACVCTSSLTHTQLYGIYDCSFLVLSARKKKLIDKPSWPPDKRFIQSSFFCESLSSPPSSIFSPFLSVFIVAKCAQSREVCK